MTKNTKERVLKLIDDRLLVDGEVMSEEQIADLYELRHDVLTLLSESDVTTELYGCYCPGEDKTFVMRDTYYDGEPRYSECVGWYFGEPDDKSTEEYSHGGKDLIAIFDF